MWITGVFIWNQQEVKGNCHYDDTITMLHCGKEQSWISAKCSILFQGQEGHSGHITFYHMCAESPTCFVHCPEYVCLSYGQHLPSELWTFPAPSAWLSIASMTNPYFNPSVINFWWLFVPNSAYFFIVDLIVHCGMFKDFLYRHFI